MSLTREERRAIRTPDQHLRVFVSSTLHELREERAAVRAAVEKLRLTPVMFELGARPHPPRDLYRAYLEQSEVFVGIYAERYGWVAPEMTISGLEDEYELAQHLPKLLYVKVPALDRDPGLTALLERIEADDTSSYRPFSATDELGELVENDLATLLSERFTAAPRIADHPVRAALPAPLSGLIGRGRELALLREHLQPAGPRLVTLTGPGGIGKTRLGLEAAREAAAAFGDGVYYVGLESIRHPELVTQAVAHALGAQDESSRPAADVLREWLHGRECLLVLDNFEQVLPAASALAAVSESCPRLHLLVTSRIPLHVRGETEILVEPLETPSVDEPIGRLEPEGYPALQLFVERARGIRHDFALSEENIEAVVEICRRTDGLPLAIELAAVQVRLLSADALLARLGTRLDALGDAPRDVPERQRTLRDTIAWSYDLLPPGSQRLFERLSVFVGGWTLEAAERVGACLDDTSSVLDQLSDLIDASLVRVAGGLDTEPRFTMLETIRQFGLERLEATGELAAAAERHADLFRDLANEAHDRLNASEQARWLVRLDRELDNIRAALDWTDAHGRTSDTLTIASSLWIFWEARGYVREAVQRLHRALGHAEGIPPEVLATALVREGWMARDLGDLVHAEELIEDGLRRWREVGDEAGIALALSNLGVILAERGSYERANALLEESLGLRRRIGDPVVITATLVNLGFLAYEQGELERAASLYTEALACARSTGDDDHLSKVLLNLGGVNIDLGELGRAAIALDEAETVNARLGDRFTSAILTGKAGLLAEKQGELAQARRKLCDAVAMFEDIGARKFVVDCVEQIARVAEREGQSETATRLLAAAETERKATGARRPQRVVPEYDALLERLRRQLGEGAFSAAWDVGAHVAFDELLALTTR